VTGLSSYGIFQSTYLTGQGRAQGDLVAIMRRVVVDDSSGAVETILSPNLKLLLTGYTQQSILLNVPVSTSRIFDHYNLEIKELDVDNGDGTTSPANGGAPPNANFVQTSFPAAFATFPGRETSMTVRLDDSMFVVLDPNNPVYSFDSDQFETANYSSVNGNSPMMNGFLSDYVMFDISNITTALATDSDPAQPPFPDASGTATALFINGDNFAIGIVPPGTPNQGDGSAWPFYALTPIGYVLGSHVGPRTGINPNTGQATLIPGTYSLVQPNPGQPLGGPGMITALVGTYKGYGSTIVSVGQNPQQFEIVAFPGSQDNGIDDCVMFNVNPANGQLSTMYFGQIDMTQASPAKRTGKVVTRPRKVHGRGEVTSTIVAWPIYQISDPSDVNYQITGTVTDVDSSGLTTVHSGHYTLDPTNLPPTFSASGRFIVYRR